MSGLYEAYIESARTAARTAAAEQARQRIKAARDAEKLLARHGQAKPFQDFVLADVESLKGTPEFDVLAQNKAFRERVEMLEREQHAAISAAMEMEQEAVQQAILNAPASVLLDKQHRAEINIFKIQNSIEDLKRAPRPVLDQYRDLLARQRTENEKLAEAM